MAAVQLRSITQLAGRKTKKHRTRPGHTLALPIKQGSKKTRHHAIPFKKNATHHELADLSGVSRETTTTLVKKLEKKGAIEQKKGNMIIHRDKLKKIQDG